MKAANVEDAKQPFRPGETVYVFYTGEARKIARVVAQGRYLEFRPRGMREHGLMETSSVTRDRRAALQYAVYRAEIAAATAVGALKRLQKELDELQ